MRNDRGREGGAADKSLASYQGSKLLEKYQGRAANAKARYRHSTSNCTRNCNERDGIPKKVFARIIKEMHTQFTHNGLPITFRQEATAALYEAADTYMIELFADARLLALHAKRDVVQPTDLHLLGRLVLDRPSTMQVCEEAREVSEQHERERRVRAQQARARRALVACPPPGCAQRKRGRGAQEKKANSGELGPLVLKRRGAKKAPAENRHGEQEERGEQSAEQEPMLGQRHDEQRKGGKDAPLARGKCRAKVKHDDKVQKVV